jgi:hypothetical protein
MKYCLLLLFIFCLVGCQALNESGSLTEAAIKQVKQDYQKKKQRTELKKATAKSVEILVAEKARDQDSSNPEKWYNLGIAYWNDYQKTERQFSHDQARDTFKSLLKMVPGNVVTIKAIYNIYYRDLILGDVTAYSTALEYFNQLTPEHQKTLNPPSLAKYIYSYYDQQKQKEINYSYLQKTLLQSIQEQPYAEASYIQLAKLYSNQSFYALAIATLKLGAEQNSESMDILKAIASTYEARASANGCHYDNGQWIIQASRYYLQAIPLQPDAADLHLGSARLFMDRNMPELAAHETQLLLAMQPSANNLAFAAHNYALMGKKVIANQYLDSAKSAGLLASDSAYHEIYMISGDWLKAALSFTDYIQSQKRLHVYDAIKADIISQQSKMNLLPLIAKKQIVYANDWQTLIYAWWQGKITQEKLESIASNKCERAELHFYSGYKAMQSGDWATAKTAFNKTIEQNTYRFIERPLAKSFLANIK